MFLVHNAILCVLSIIMGVGHIYAVVEVMPEQDESLIVRTVCDPDYVLFKRMRVSKNMHSHIRVRISMCTALVGCFALGFSLFCICMESVFDVRCNLLQPWLLLYYLSKFYEFLDTVFIVVRKVSAVQHTDTNIQELLSHLM